MKIAAKINGATIRLIREGGSATTKTIAEKAKLEPTPSTRNYVGKVLANSLADASRLAKSIDLNGPNAEANFSDLRAALAKQNIAMVTYDFKKKAFVSPSLVEFKKLRQKKQNTMASTNAKRGILDDGFGIRPPTFRVVIEAALARGDMMLVQDMIGTKGLF